VLLLVGLASLTRVETQVATNTQSLATARQNALLGLNVALGQLQLHAGPDQRTTARADLVAGKINPLYTGVWDTTAPGTLAPATPSVWLVSGNEDPASPLAVNPDTNLAADPDAILLVGPNTAGPENPAPAPSNHVRVRRRTLTADNVPGLAGSQPVGAYAYWVGDEGVKARPNLASPGLSGTATDPQAARSFASSPRAAIELMERAAVPASGVVGTTWSNALFPYNPDNINTVLNPEQLPFYAPAATTAAAQTAARARFHDLTTRSSSVLADTASGGLRLDLTRILSSSVGPADTDFIFPVSGSPGAFPHQNPPTWGRLRQWWQTPVDPATDRLAPSLPTATTPSIAPVILWAEMGFALYYDAPIPPATNYRLRFQGFPRLVLWNPYNVPLQASTYELGISSVTGSTSVRIEQETGGTFIQMLRMDGYRFAPTATGGINRRYLRFRVVVPELAPGQAKAFTLNSSSNGTSYNPSNTTLEAGDFPSRNILFDGADETFDTPLAPPYRGIAFGNETTSAITPTSGDYMVYLRQVGSLPADPGPPNHNAPPTGTYGFIPRMGYFQNNTGLYGAGSAIFTIASTPAVLPQLRLVSKARMGTTSGNPQRWLANASPLGFFSGRHGADGDSHPFYGAAFFATGGSPLQTIPPDDDVSVGTDLAPPTLGGAPHRLVLREPRLADPGLYQSIAQLQHAPLSETALGPLYAVGNSLQNPRIRTRTDTARTAGEPLANPLYDSSYLLNQALWDRYFFSTAPATAAALAATDFSLPAPRLRARSASGGLPAATALLDHQTAAANMLLDGGFNINSTSEQAWRALLASANNLIYNPNTGQVSGASPLASPVSRFQRPVAGPNDPWSGYRPLTDTQVAALAANIVAEVRARGPFKSLADFVNRRLAADATGLKGTLQAAIETTDLDANPVRRINDLSPYTLNPADALPTGGVVDLDPEAYRGTAGGVARLPVSSRNAFGPGFVTQADVLSRIGSAISARSDTFLIRVYGETRNPAVDGTVPTARAWAEAVVQRLPEYLDDSTPAQNAPLAGSTNERFGRRFTIVSFRWLTPQDI
jgi:hypothetical protein